MPRKLMWLKWPGPMRRSQRSSMTWPSLRSRSTTLCTGRCSTPEQCSSAAHAIPRLLSSRRGAGHTRVRLFRSKSRAEDDEQIRRDSTACVHSPRSSAWWQAKASRAQRRRGATATWHYAARRTLTASLLNSRLASSRETGIRESMSVERRLSGNGTVLSFYRLRST